VKELCPGVDYTVTIIYPEARRTLLSTTEGAWAKANATCSCPRQQQHPHNDAPVKQSNNMNVYCSPLNYYFKLEILLLYTTPNAVACHSSLCLTAVYGCFVRCVI
jgi:hypothetical protein